MNRNLSALVGLIALILVIAAIVAMANRNDETPTTINNEETTITNEVEPTTSPTSALDGGLDTVTPDLATTPSPVTTTSPAAE